MIKEGTRVRLKPFKDEEDGIDEPEQYGECCGSAFRNTVIVQLDRQYYNPNREDGLREVSLDQVEEV